jgi:hypothetical protein
MTTDIKQKSSLFKIIIIVIVGCISIPFALNFALKFAADTIFPAIEPGGVYGIRKTSDQFVTSLKDGDKEEMYRLIDDAANGSQVMRDIEALVNEDAIINYDGLDICDWRDEGEMTDNFGLIYFNETSMRFNIQLIEDADKSWKVHRFMLLPELEPGPFENCQ